MPSPPSRLSALALAGVIGLAACGGDVRRPPCPPGKLCLERGNTLEALTLDPQTSNLVDESTIIGDLMMGLTTEAPDSSAMPGMAASWETSADGLVWTFHLRPALWSDGTPVTAEDFVYGYRRMLDPKTASIYAYLLYLLKNGQAVNEGKAAPETLGVRALDPRTLQLVLEHPAPYLTQLTKHQSFFPVPRHVVERYGDDWVRPGRYVSNGPYRLVSWRLGDKIQVEKNPRFFDAARVCFDRINYTPTPEAVTAERRVARGEIDINSNFQSNRLQHIRKTMPGYARTHLWLSANYVVFNTRDVEPLKDIRVRRALSQAVDRDFITGKLLRAGQVPAYSFVPPAVANYAPGAQVVWANLAFAERQAQARALLAQAGFGPERPLKLEMKVSNTTDTQLIAQAVQADWRAVGVQVDIVQNEGQIAFAAYRERDFQVGLAGWAADFNDPVTFLGLFQSSTGGQNYGDYSNPAYDALLAAADREPNAGRRAHLLARAEQILLADEGIAPLYFNVSRNLVNPRISGWVDNVENWHRTRWLCARDGKPAAQR